MIRALTNRQLRREMICIGLDRRQRKAAAVFEFDMAGILTEEFQARSQAFMGDQATKDLLSEMVSPGAVSLDDAGRVVFKNDVLQRFSKHGNKALGTDYARAVRPSVADLTAKEHRTGGKETAKTIGFNPSFKLPDDRSVRQLHRDGMYWIKTGHARNVVPEIPRLVEDVLKQGLSQTDAAKLLAEKLGGRYAVEKSRWNVVASAAMNKSRSHSKIKQMIQWTVTHYEWLSVLDERTSDVCRELHGNTWETKPAGEVVETTEIALSPEDAIDAQPWVSIDKDGQWWAHTSAGKKPTSPEALGAPLPPIHGRCRSTIVPSEQVSYESKTKIVKGGTVRASEKPRSPVTDTGSVAAKLRDLGVTPPAAASKYTVADLSNIAQPGAYTAEFVNVAEAWAATDEAVVLSTGWLDKETAREVLGWTLYAEEEVVSLAVVGEQRLPTAVWEGIAGKLKALAKDKGIAAAVTVPKGSATLAMGFRGWAFAPSTAEAYAAWMESEGIAAKLAKRGGRGRALVPDSPFDDWLKINVGGQNPLMTFLQEAGDVRLLPAGS